MKKKHGLNFLFIFTFLFVWIAPLVAGIEIVPRRLTSYPSSGSVNDFVARFLTTKIPFPYLGSKAQGFSVSTVDVPWILVAMAFALILPVVIAATRILPFFHGEEYKSARQVFYVALTSMILFVTPLIKWLAILATVVSWYGIIFGWIAAFLGLSVALYALFGNQKIRESAGVSRAMRDWFSEFGSGFRRAGKAEVREEEKDTEKEGEELKELDKLFEVDASLDREELSLIEQLKSALRHIPEIFHDVNPDNKSQLLNILNAMFPRLLRLKEVFNREVSIDKEEEELLAELYNKEKREIINNNQLQQKLTEFDNLREKVTSNPTFKEDPTLRNLIYELDRLIRRLKQAQENLNEVDEKEARALRDILRGEKKEAINKEIKIVDKLINEVRSLENLIWKKPQEAANNLSTFLETMEAGLRELETMEKKDSGFTEEEKERLKQLLRRFAVEVLREREILPLVREVQTKLNLLKSHMA